MTKYDYSQVKREISGFGGAYEEACRKMVVAAAQWLDDHPEASPKFYSFEKVTGLIKEDNDDAKEMSKAALSACPDCTGAMHQYAVLHALFINRNGWDSYVQRMNELEDKQFEDRQDEHS